jgi:hypothetical protein
MQMAAVAIGCCLALALTSRPSPAQFMGHNFKGDFGLLAGTQPDPGFYLAGAYVLYDGDTIRDRNGEVVALDPDRHGDIKANGLALAVWYVSDFKILGGNYGFMVVPALTNNKLEVPILATQATTGMGFGDLYVQPINLGWQTQRADFIAGLGFYAPTGRYAWDADDNLGLGMWSFELAAGTTVYFDEAKTWNLATTAYFETHTDKKDSSIRVGNILTLEGGLGKSFLGGGINVGLAYYAQWKLSQDDFGELGPLLEQELGVDTLPKHRVFGFGPDVTVPIATKKKLIAMLNVRYFWEVGARTTLQGNTLTVMATFPIPSVPLD